MSFLKGIAKAGSGIVGGVVHGAGKVVEDIGHVAESAPIVGGVVGGVVAETGKVVETVGDAISGGKKEEHKEPEEVVDEKTDDIVKDEEYYNPFFGDTRVFVSLDGDDDRAYYDDSLEDLIAYDVRQAKLRAEAADGGDEKMDEP